MAYAQRKISMQTVTSITFFGNLA